jgi:sarcosine oxidase, subunit alpha
MARNSGPEPAGIAQAVARTPLEAVAERHGAEFRIVDGWRVAWYPGSEGKLAPAGEGVALVDATPCGKIVVEGHRVDELFRAVGVDSLPVVGTGIEATRLIPGAWVYRLRADRLFISTPPGSEGRLVSRLEREIGRPAHLVTVSDLTHGWYELHLVGAGSGSLLRKFCGVELGGEAFPDRTARETSVAKIYQLVIRRDVGSVPSFALLGARSLGEYLWGVLLEAGAVPR